jgi:hypothetical protein
MAVHPLVPCATDSPFSVIRLKLAMRLFNHCEGILPEAKSKVYFIYLQRYYLSKGGTDLTTAFEYENLMKKYDKGYVHFQTYKEADEHIARMENAISKCISCIICLST